MKKVSAFSVFKTKKEEDSTPKVDLNTSKRSTVKKASSAPTINEVEKKSNKILKAFRGGSFRGTIRGAKHRPELLPSGNGESPFVAGDAGQVKLTGIRHKKPKTTGVSRVAAKKGVQLFNSAETGKTPQTAGKVEIDEGKQPTSVRHVCLICGDIASSKHKTHYGIRTCIGCADFFRRSVRLGKQYVCIKDETCEVTPETRNDCKYCRLKKCFDVGMPHDEILLSDSQEQNEDLPSNRRVLSPAPTICVVCGDIAYLIHYGVRCCQACGDFFHRTLRTGKQYVCEKEENCSITKETRQDCSACRLQQCYAVGMSKKSNGQEHESKKTTSPCLICGDSTKMAHYGVPSCDACGDFFLRALRSQRTIVCDKDGNCPITKETRHNCQYCRLQKCFALGMKRKAKQNSPSSPAVTSVLKHKSSSQVLPLSELQNHLENNSFISDLEDVKDDPVTEFQEHGSVESDNRGGKRQLEQTPQAKSKRRKVQEEESVKIKDDDSPVPHFSPRSGMQAYMYDSSVEAEKLFECMIHPVQTDKFFKELWQKKPLLVRRHITNYNDGWFSTQELDRILRTERIEFGVNLDVTTYKDGKRETHNPIGRAFAPVVWDFYQTGCSVRLLNPQTYSEEVWKMLSVLQEYFSCCVGANVYLTPPGTQGFAPHYDDIEAFILQLEGKKHWKLYNPRNDSEVLPRTSSANFTASDIGEPILDVILHAGDLLYFPRGIIHQGCTSEDAHSLHITFSCYQKNTWADLLEKLVPTALQIAIEENVEFRQGLPRDYLSYMGVAHSEEARPERQEFLKKITDLMFTMIEKHCPVDSACDQMGKQFLHDSLPPALTEAEKSRSIHGHGEFWDGKNHCVVGTTELEPDTEVKIIRKGVLRLVTEEDTVRIYHSLENERLYHAKDPQFIEISAEAAPAVEFLIHSYPEYVTVDSLPYCSVSDKVEIASILYDKGLLLTKVPLDLNMDDNDDPENDGH